MTRARVLSCGNEEVVFWTGEIAFIRLKMAKMLTLVAFLVGISCGELNCVPCGKSRVACCWACGTAAIFGNQSRITD